MKSHTSKHQKDLNTSLISMESRKPLLRPNRNLMCSSWIGHKQIIEKQQASLTKQLVCQNTGTMHT